VLKARVNGLLVGNSPKRKMRIKATTFNAVLELSDIECQISADEGNEKSYIPAKMHKILV
jgi:hypothetical protein